MKTFARHINLLLIAALVLAGVSPACEFISGRSLAEICKADGTVEKTAIPAELEIFLAAKVDKTTDDNSKHIDLSDCAFCFTQGNLKLSLAKAISTPAPAVISSVLALSLHATAPVQSSLSPFEARGPPSLLS